MGIKLSDVQPQPTATERLQAGFLIAWGGLLAGLQKIVLPHLLGALAWFLLVSYGVYKVWLSVPYTTPIHWTATLLILGGYALSLAGYALVLSVVWGIYSAAAYAEDFFYELFDALKEKIRRHIQSMDEGMAKQQAKVILDNSLRDVLAPLKAWRIRSASALAGAFLALLTFISRSVFLAKLARVSGATIQWSRVFASRATLVGALFLNMRWLAILLLWLLYAAGAVALLFTLVWIW